MITKEELLKCFQSEITAISEAEIAEAQREMKEIRLRTEQEINEGAQEAARLWFEQEAQDLSARHAVAMSHINDENHRRLMTERSLMAEELFEAVKQQLMQFHKDKQYQELITKKISAYANRDETLVLQLGHDDEALMKQLLSILGNRATGEIVDDIVLGGFRLVLKDKERAIDETLDSALIEARKDFLQTSALTIA
ncbi:MAG: hypothetical protein HFE82_02790 [Erysipelotrichaceae bacterium]|nr:hypothetical protein [Erysipelotrichaceae bacterium]